MLTLNAIQQATIIHRKIVARPTLSSVGLVVEGVALGNGLVAKVSCFTAAALMSGRASEFSFRSYEKSTRQGSRTFILMENHNSETII